MPRVSADINTLLLSADKAAARANLDLEPGTDVLAFAAAASQAEMEAGTEAALRTMSPLRVAQAIAALGGGGGGGTWGSITGTLSAQTDLQTALDEKVSSDITGLTGATVVNNLVAITSAGYAAIGSPDANTIYNITDAAAGTLAQFDATTSAQLAGVISDETGTGALVFAESPTLVTPALGTPSSGTLTNCTGLPTAGLVDDAVTLAKMASGTAGNLITYDASGNPAAVATGTATHVLTSNGAGAAPTFQAVPGTSSATGKLAADFDLTSTGNFEDTGLSVTLPAAGTYLVSVNARITLTMGAGAGYIACKLYNSTAAADVTDSERLNFVAIASNECQLHSGYTWLVTVGVSSVIKFYAGRFGAGTFSVSKIASDSNGWTTMLYKS